MNTIGSGTAPESRFSSRATHFLTAAQALAEILLARRPADAIVHDHFRKARSGSRDRALISSLVYGVLREIFPLRTLLGTSASTLDFCVAHACRAGIKLPPLRETDPDSLRATMAAGPDLPAAARHNLSDTLWQRLVAQYSEPEASALAMALNQEAAVDLRINLLRGTREQGLARLAADGVEAYATAHAETGVRVDRRLPLQSLPSYLEGWIEPQDEGSQLLALAMAPKSGERIADFCAGAGGKTLALGALMGNTGELHAFDSSGARLDRMTPRLQRAGLTMVTRHTLEPDVTVPPAMSGSFDAVLVDAPCSGSGTLRRHPELRLQDPDLLSLAATQAAVLRKAAILVRPGGRLMYATCSVLAEENEAVTTAFLAKDRGFIAGQTLRLLPHRDGTDGYYALMLRRDPAPGAPAARR